MDLKSGVRRSHAGHRHPPLADPYILGVSSGASIQGGETVIGRDSVIGSNVFITGSIPPCTTVSVKSQELQIRQRGGCCPEPFWPGSKENQ